MIVQEGFCLFRKNKTLLIEHLLKPKRTLNKKIIEATKMHEEKSYQIFKKNTP